MNHLKRFIPRPAIVVAMTVLAVSVPAAAVAGLPGRPRHVTPTTACLFTTQLRAANETTGSTSTATGHTQIRVLNDGTLAFNTRIYNPNAETFVAGHLHTAGLQAAGAIVVPLFEGSTSSADIVQAGSLTITAHLAADICRYPENYYVNYHTTHFPAGAIRGQLR